MGGRGGVEVCKIAFTRHYFLDLFLSFQERRGMVSWIPHQPATWIGYYLPRLELGFVYFFVLQIVHSKQIEF